MGLKRAFVPECNVKGHQIDFVFYVTVYKLKIKFSYYTSQILFIYRYLTS